MGERKYRIEFTLPQLQAVYDALGEEPTDGDFSPGATAYDRVATALFKARRTLSEDSHDE